MNWHKTVLSMMMPVMMLAALPSSSSYQLNSYGFGTGGTANTHSTSYSVNGISGEVAGSSASTNYKVGAGENYEKQAHVPTVTLINSGNWYNKLLLTIGPENNPTDAKFAVAISTDNFATAPQYVKSDFTVGASLTFTDYQTYSSWGSGSGVYVRGLTRSTVYTVKVKAFRGEFTESPYGPVASAATVDPQISFDIDASATDSDTNPPYQIGFGNLPVSTVTDSPQRVWVDLDTNGESGGKVYMSGQNAGLRSLESNYTIASSTADLSSLAEGFGAQGVSATQSSGGPFALVAPYNGAGANVGVADTVIREIFSTSFPVTAARGSFILKAKTKPLTPAAGDYTEILTAIASASF